MNTKPHNLANVRRAVHRRPELRLRSCPLLPALLLAVIGLLGAGRLHAQSTITWNTPAAIAGDTDVATNGTLAYAYTESGMWAMVNGVSFAAGNRATSLGSDVTLSGFDGGVDIGTYIGGNPVGLSSAYQTVVRGGAFSSGGAATVTLNNLTSGHQYLVQFWVCDYRTYAANRSETLSDGSSASGNLTYLTSTVGPTCGTYVTGTFTANGTSQVIMVTPTSTDASAQMNAIQVRDLSPSPTPVQMIIYQDLFNDQQNINRGGPYTQSLGGSYPTVRNGFGGGSTNATWTFAAETGGWGQRDYNNNGVATPTSSSYLPFTPQAGHLYLLTATIDATAWNNGEWFTIAFTQSPGNWGGTGNYVADLNNLVRGGQVNTISVTLDTRDPGWSNTNNLAYVGWVTDVAGQVNLSAAQQLTIDNFSLVIQNEHPFTNTYNANGATSGTVPVDGSSPYFPNSVVTVVGNTGSLAKSGYNFAGWNTAADGSGTPYSAGSTFTITNNTVLYAHWVSGYTVTYNGNGNTGGSVPVDANSYGSGASATVLGSGTLVKTGYVFTNWNTVANGSGASYNSGSSLTVNSNTTLYAQWNLGQYTATYLAGAGGTISGTATQTVTYGTSTTPVTAVPNVSGYRFAGWSDGVLTATRSDVNFSSNLTVTASFDNNLTWDNGGGTFAWNTTDTNWTGAVWNNSIPDNAIFNNGSNTVNLTQAITAGSLTANYGGNPSGPHNLVIAGNSLSLASILSWGGYNPAAGGGGVDSISQAINQRLTISNSTVKVTGNVTIRRGSFMAQGSSVLNVNGFVAPDAWSVLLMQDSAVVTATNGVDLSTIACAVYLNGGTLTTPFVNVGNATWNGASGLYLNGITVVPSQASTDFLQVFNNGDTNSRAAATIGSGGLVFDSAHDVTIATALTGSGSFTKKGAGTLTLAAAYAANAYAGKTVVQGGTLSIGSTTALPSGPVTITSGAKMDLNYFGTIQIAGLILNGVAQPDGTYGSSLSGATYTNDTYFTNSGVLSVSRPTALTWDDGTGTGNWNSTDANWTGLVWNNTFPDSALFTAVGGTVNLTQAITADSVTVGNTSLNVPNVTFTNGSLTAASLTVQGSGNNSGAYTSNPTLTLAVPTVSVAGDMAAGRANLLIASGTVTANRIISAADSADWADVVINGGSVTATNGVDGSAYSGATFQLDLNGGSLYTPFITVADREVGANNNAWLNFNGTVVHPTASTGNFITLYGGNQNTYVGNGGVRISTDGNDIGIGVNLVASGTGGLTKSGSGTLTLSGTSTYTGPTHVQGGVLSIGSTSSLGGGAVDIASGAKMDLNYAGQIQVTSLTLNGVVQPVGTYGATGSGATHTNDTYFTGSGVLYVPPSPTLAYVKSGNNLTFTWDGTGLLEWQTNALSTGLSTNWVAYPNGTNGVQVPMDATQGSVFFRVKR